MEYQERNKEIIRTSVVGIAANVLLAGFKAVSEPLPVRWQ